VYLLVMKESLKDLQIFNVNEDLSAHPSSFQTKDLRKIAVLNYSYRDYSNGCGQKVSMGNC
jgi:hypothetical protein